MTSPLSRIAGFSTRSHSDPMSRAAPHPSGDALDRFLGYFSIGLGLAEVLAPRALARLTGVRHLGLLQAYGLRELAAGIGVLNDPRPSGWLWARVAGDALDLLTLAKNLDEADARERQRVLTSLLSVAGVTVLDILAAARHSIRRTH